MQSQGQGGRSGAFSGRGRTLAGDAPEQDAPQAPQAPTQPPEQTMHTITFYTNGIFTVDNGTPVISIMHGLSPQRTVKLWTTASCFFERAITHPFKCASVSLRWSV